MGSRYVEVSREDMVNALTKAGFTASPLGGELMFYRVHHLDSTMMVKIYTSMPRNGGDSRACGEDAIRVVLIFSTAQRSGCLYKATRVFRTGTSAGVIERTLDRAREAYAAGTLRHRGIRENLDQAAKQMVKAKRQAEV